jgi:hypothetical protein
MIKIRELAVVSGVPLLIVGIFCQSGCAPSAEADYEAPTSTAIARNIAREHPARDVRYEKQLYTPSPDDFRPIYEKDKANKSRQDWDEYYSWVKTFYTGNILEAGWTKRAMSVLEALKSEEIRDQVRATLNELSRQIAAEWSKDNDVRKINNSDLTSLGSRLLRAKSKDDGSGGVIRRELDAILSEVESKLRH